jgi:DNA-directed RNA polymerase subunit alpha
LSHGLDTVIGGKSLDAQKAATLIADAQRFEAAHDKVSAIGAYRAALHCSNEPNITFRLAILLDLVGEEDEAIKLYSELTNSKRPHLNALVNLAVLLEDRGQVVRAERMLRQVVATEPNHERGNLFLKDVSASRDMVVTPEEFVPTTNAILDTPVTDFELSVRARNCLKKMQIRTLGDLLRISEAELMSYKNFGEQSLGEIKQMLTLKGLRLGQSLEGSAPKVRSDVYEQLREKYSEELLARSISSLELSVRARKALQLLNIATLGDLAARTEAELMGVKNFGATSLVEIKERLIASGLNLRTLD